jgi:hypothetical protein
VSWEWMKEGKRDLPFLYTECGGTL